jgi:hypothetical protein
MFDAAGLAQVARKAMDRMTGERIGVSLSEPGDGASSPSDPHVDRAVFVLRAVHPELSLRQAEALLRERGSK